MSAPVLDLQCIIADSMVIPTSTKSRPEQQPLELGEPALGCGAAHPHLATMHAAQAWVVIVTFRFASLEDRDALVTRVGELAAHLREHAPDVLSFRVATLDSDPSSVALIERCEGFPIATGQPTQCLGHD